MQTKPTIYTEASVKEILASMLEEAEDQSNDTVSFKELFVKRKISQQRFTEWREKFSSNAEISESLARLKDIYENKLFKGGIYGTMNANLVKFGLMANYDWKDRQEVEQSGDSSLTIKWGE